MKGNSLCSNRDFLNKAALVFQNDGIMTGFHEPEASHLDMLTAFLRPEALFQAYREAVREKYLWPGFGDIDLILQVRNY